MPLEVAPPTLSRRAGRRLATGRHACRFGAYTPRRPGWQRSAAHSRGGGGDCDAEVWQLWHVGMAAVHWLPVCCSVWLVPCLTTACGDCSRSRSTQLAPAALRKSRTVGLQHRRHPGHLARSPSRPSQLRDKPGPSTRPCGIMLHGSRQGPAPGPIQHCPGPATATRYWHRGATAQGAAGRACTHLQPVYEVLLLEQGASVHRWLLFVKTSGRMCATQWFNGTVGAAEAVHGLCPGGGHGGWRPRLWPVNRGE